MTPTSEKILLTAEARTVTGKAVGKLRKTKKIPAVLYGHGLKNINLAVADKEFEKIFNRAGTSSLVQLQIGDQPPVPVLIQNVQKDILTEKVRHIDFHQVKMSEKISAEVNLKFVGEAKAVKEAGGILVKNLNALKVECLPQDLVQEIEVDISSLKSFEDIIRVKDLNIPANLQLKEKGDEAVVRVQPPRSEEELKALEEKPEEKVAEVPVAGKEKAAEGEEAPAGEETAKPETKAKEQKSEK